MAKEADEMDSQRSRSPVSRHGEWRPKSRFSMVAQEVVVLGSGSLSYVTVVACPKRMI